MEKIQNSQRIKSIDRALDILEFLSNNGDDIGISDISRGIGMGLSTVHRIINTLKSRGYIIQNQKTLKYRLGIKLFELGCKVYNTKHLIKIARPYLRKLSKMTSETVNLAILEDKEVVYLDTIESIETLRTGIVRGTRTAAHCTALGKVLLSSIPGSDFKQLYKNSETIIQLTPKSLTSLVDLKKELKKVKKQGYAFDQEESMIGINCVGVPIFNGNKEVIMAISITGPSSRFTVDKMKDVKEKLIITAKEVSSLF